MKELNIIEISGKGNFIRPTDKLFIIPEKTHIAFNYCSPENKSKVPLIITNFNNRLNKRTKIPPEAHLNMSFKELLDNYNCLEGSYEDNLNWSCECFFKEPGLYSFQILFYKDWDRSADLLTSQDYFIDSFSSLSDEKTNGKDSSIDKELKYIIGEKIEKIIVTPFYSNPINNNTIIKKYNFINLITIYPTMLGSIDTWEEKLKGLIDRGYTGFHFCPIQELGVSKSLYCLKDHENPNPNLFGSKSFDDLKAIFVKLKKENNVFFLIDIIWNHCSINSDWLLEDKEAFFSPENTPILTVASILDKKLFEISNKFKELNITDSNKIKTFQDVDAVLAYLNEEIEKIKIEEYFKLNVEKKMKEILALYNDPDITDFKNILTDNNILINFLQKNDYDAIKEQLIDLGRSPFGVEINSKWLAYFLKDRLFRLNTFEIKRVLEDVNKQYGEKVKAWKSELINNLKGEIEYRFLKQQKCEVSKDYPLVTRYFQELDNGQMAALNGWILNYSSDEDFIVSQEQFYLRRCLIVWSDLIKLRYENKEAKIWEKMNRYTRQMAKVFDGFRLDNFHNTKLSAAQSFIGNAFKINQRLYIISELFTPSKEVEINLCSSVGVHRLVREMQNCYSSKDLFQTFKYYSDTDSFLATIPKLKMTNNEISYLPPKNVFYIFYDQTHDNPTYFEKFGVYIQLPISALLSFYNRMIGSVVGFDELYAKHIKVTYDKPYPSIPSEVIEINQDCYEIVFTLSKQDIGDYKDEINTVELRGDFNYWKNGVAMIKEDNGQFWIKMKLEKGKYQFKFIINGHYWTVNKCLPFTDDGKGNINNTIIVNRTVKLHRNLVHIRSFFNNLHQKFSISGAKIHMEHHPDNFIVIQRFSKEFNHCYVLITRLNYNNDDPECSAEFILPGWLSKIKKCYYIDKQYDIIDSGDIPYIKANIYEESDFSRFGQLIHSEKSLNDVLRLKNVPTNFVLVLKTVYSKRIINTINSIENSLEISPEDFQKTYLTQIELRDINYYLYVCDNEEREYWKSGTYEIPDHGKLPFAGFCGLNHILKSTSLKMDYDHLLYKHIRKHDYLLNYYLQRINKYRPGEHTLFKKFFHEIIEKLKDIPRFLIPVLFHRFISLIISGFEVQLFTIIKAPEYFKNNNLYRSLLITLPQFMTSNDNRLYLVSAGLPHFSTGVWKNWGRDTFISFKGVFIISGLYKQGRELILHYASYLRHGLIPNMLEPSRYNSRDATWWFVKAVKDYMEASNDYDILHARINMKFLSDDQQRHNELKGRNVESYMNLIDILQKIFQTHAEGIQYREWNSPDIDSHMNYNGFHISLYTDWKTGFIFGGNKSNCLTWMDKMGSSVKAKNKGVPATPRLGAPIELTSLLYIGLKFMKMLYSEGYSNYKGITTTKFCITYEDWKNKVKNNFEQHFWIPEEEAQFCKYKVESDYVISKGIFKDCYSGTMQDYKLRPNALIAIALTPKLFKNKNIKSFIKMAEMNLIVS